MCGCLGDTVPMPDDILMSATYAQRIAFVCEIAGRLQLKPRREPARIERGQAHPTALRCQGPISRA